MKPSHVLFAILLIGITLYLYYSQNMLGLVLVTGFLDGIHPCGFTVLLFFIAFLLSMKRSRRGILLLGGLYILGVFIAYFGIGLGIMKAVVFFEHHLMAKAGALLLLAVGAINIKDGLMDTTTLSIPKFAKPRLAQYIEKATALAALVAGILVGLCAFPCVGGLYVAIITMISATGIDTGTLGLLVTYNLMFVLPLLLTLFFAADERVLDALQEKEKANRRNFRLAMGAFMILFALYIIWTV